MPCQEAASLNGSVLSAMPNGRHATGRASTIRCPRPRSGTAGPPIDAAERNAGAMPSMNCSPLQPEYVAWLDPLPDSLRATPTGESLQAIADLDLGARPRLIRPWLWTRLIRRETPTKPLTLRAPYKAPAARPNAMVHLLARIIGVGIETADMLVREALSRNLRDRRAVARYAGLTGSPDESGSMRREKGLARSGNARVRRGLIQLAWRFLMFQKDSALVRWYRSRTEGPKGARKTTMIVALARKLLIALWRMVTTGVVPEGVVLRPVA